MSGLFWFVVDYANGLFYKAFKVIDNALADLGGDD